MIEKISLKEHRRLIALTNNDIAIADCSSKTGITTGRLQHIAQTGVGSLRHIDRLRVYINYNKSKLFIDAVA